MAPPRMVVMWVTRPPRYLGRCTRCWLVVVSLVYLGRLVKTIVVLVVLVVVMVCRNLVLLCRLWLVGKFLTQRTPWLRRIVVLTVSAIRGVWGRLVEQCGRLVKVLTQVIPRFPRSGSVFRPCRSILSRPVSLIVRSWLVAWLWLVGDGRADVVKRTCTTPDVVWPKMDLLSVLDRMVLISCFVLVGVKLMFVVSAWVGLRIVFGLVSIVLVKFYVLCSALASRGALL